MGYKNFTVGILSLIIKKKVLGTTKPFDERFHIIGDFDLMIRLSTKFLNKRRKYVRLFNCPSKYNK